MRKVIHVVLLVLVFFGASSFVYADSVEHVIGSGIGLPYGGVGLNYELGFNDYIAATGGVGYLPDNVGWNAGLRVYYPGRDYKFRVRLTGLYGTNTVLEEKGPIDSEYDTETGFSGGVGFNWRFGRAWALDSDLFLVDSDVPDGYEEKGSDVKFSIGVSYRL